MPRLPIVNRCNRHCPHHLHAKGSRTQGVWWEKMGMIRVERWGLLSWSWRALCTVIIVQRLLLVLFSRFHTGLAGWAEATTQSTLTDFHRKADLNLPWWGLRCENGTDGVLQVMYQSVSVKNKQTLFYTLTPFPWLVYTLKRSTIAKVIEKQGRWSEKFAPHLSFSRWPGRVAGLRAPATAAVARVGQGSFVASPYSLFTWSEK